MNYTTRLSNCNLKFVRYTSGFDFIQGTEIFCVETGNAFYIGTALNTAMLLWASYALKSSVVAEHNRDNSDVMYVGYAGELNFKNINKASKFVLIGANPFRHSYTGLKVVARGDTPLEMAKLWQNKYEECGGLMLVVNTETGNELLITEEMLNEAKGTEQ